MDIQFYNHPTVCYLVYALMMISASYTTLRRHLNNTTPPTYRSAEAEPGGTTHVVNAPLRWWRVDVSASVFGVVSDCSARLGQIWGFKTRWRKKGVEQHLRRRRVLYTRHPSSSDLMGTVWLWASVVRKPCWFPSSHCQCQWISSFEFLFVVRCVFMVINWELVCEDQF